MMIWTVIAAAGALAAPRPTVADLGWLVGEWVEDSAGVVTR